MSPLAPKPAVSVVSPAEKQPETQPKNSSVVLKNVASSSTY